MSVHKQLIAHIITVTVLIASMLTLGGCFLFSNPHAQFSFTPESGYPPLIVHFDGNASNSPNGAIVSYAWDFDDHGSTDTEASVDHTFYDRRTYVVTLTVTDASQAVGAITYNVKVLNHTPEPHFTFWPSNQQAHQQTEFDARDSYDEEGRIVDWQWSFGDGTTGTGDMVDHIYEVAGTYTVRLTVIDEDGTPNSLTRNVTIIEDCGCG